MLNIRNSQPDGGKISAHGRCNHFGHVQFPGQGRSVKRGSPSHRDKSKLPQVIPFFHGVAADALGHVGIDDPDDAKGCFFQGEAHFVRHMRLNGSAGQVRIKRELSPQKVISVEAAQNKVRIRDRR